MVPDKLPVGTMRERVFLGKQTLQHAVQHSILRRKKHGESAKKKQTKTGTLGNTGDLAS